jgi:hypothetical protein
MIGVLRCFAMNKTAESKFRDYCGIFLKGYHIKMIEENELRTLTGKMFILLYPGTGRTGDAVKELENRFSGLNDLEGKKPLLVELQYTCIYLFIYICAKFVVSVCLY